MRELICYRTVAEQWKVPLGTLYALVHRRQIPFVRISKRTVRFDVEALEEYLSKRRCQPATPIEFASERGGEHD